MLTVKDHLIVIILVNAKKLKVNYVTNHDEKHGELAPYYKYDCSATRTLVTND